MTVDFSIHFVSTAFVFFFLACGERQGGDTFLDSIDNSSWLKHIKCVLDTSYFIAKVCHVTTPKLEF